MTVTTQAIVAILKRAGERAALITGGIYHPKVARSGFQCRQYGDKVGVYYFAYLGLGEERARKLREYTELIEKYGYKVTEVDGIRLTVEREG